MPIPTPTIVADLVIKTKWAFRRSRLYYEPDNQPADEIMLGKAADAIFGKWQAQIAACMPDEHMFQRVECRYYGPGNSGFFANSSNAAIAGDIETPDENTSSQDLYTGTEDIMPDESCLIIQKKTGKIGRSNQGRLFITGLSERLNFAGEVSALFRGQATALATILPQQVSVMAMEYSAVLSARHYNRKTSTMVPITKCYAVNAIGSRRDRRRPTPMERL